MVNPPAWFVRELRIIDHRYRIVPSEESQSYRIVMDADIIIPHKINGSIHIQGPKTVDVFRYLNDDALTKLRQRKYWGRMMKIIENPRVEWNFLQNQEKAAKQKEMDLAHEIMAEGIMEGYRIERKHSVS